MYEPAFFVIISQTRYAFQDAFPIFFPKTEDDGFASRRGGAVCMSRRRPDGIIKNRLCGGTACSAVLSENCPVCGSGICHAGSSGGFCNGVKHIGTAEFFIF